MAHFVARRVRGRADGPAQAVLPCARKGGKKKVKNPANVPLQQKVTLPQEGRGYRTRGITSRLQAPVW